MKTCKKLSVLAILTLALATILFSAPNAYAATSTLSLSSASDGDSVQLAITGAVNSNVVFYYTKIGAGLQINYLGKTDANGNFSSSLSTAAYGISGNTVVYVTVNGQKSNEAAWPYLAAASVLSLSQTSVILPLGQTSTLTVYNNGTNFVYLSSNSNPPVVNVNVDGNKVTLKALNFGSTVVNVCAGIGTPSCASVYVTVQNTGGQALAFSQNNPTVAAGQNVAVTVIGGIGTYTLLNNVNANVIKASLSGNTVTLSTTNTSGSSAITICSSDMSSCGIINAVVGNVSSSGLTFSITNPTMSIGQNLSITISGGAGGDYSIFSNTNTDAVSANISDSGLVLIANNGGVATITVCSSMGNCTPEVVTVNYNTARGGSMTLSQNNLWLLAGQSSSITVSGGTMPYSAVGYSENTLKASFNNNILTITGVNAGSALVNICSAGGCIGLSVLVSGSSSADNSTALTLSQSSVAIKAGSSATVSISGNGSYFIAYNTSSSVATATINGSNIVVNASAAGSTDVSICQNGGQCAVLKVTVSITAAPLSLSQTSLALSVGGLGKILISGDGGYSIFKNTNAGIASAAISGNAATITALSAGNTSISICQNGGQCVAVSVIVTAASTPTTESGWTSCANEKQLCSFTGSQTVRYGANDKYYYGTFANDVACTNSIFGDPIVNVAKQCYYGGVIPAGAETTSPVGEKFKFTKTLVYGAKGNDVKELQKRLTAEGFYKGAIDGKFLTSTVVAVKKYQKSKGIKQTGNVGTLTMAALNK
jgi:hypothetical protein